MNKYGLIGNPVKHSFSEKYFTKKFEDEAIKAKYKTFLLKDIHEFPKLIKSEKKLCGLNVTIPFKESILPFLDHIEPQAKTIGAVNTIHIKNGETTGYNTDNFGFMKSLFPLLERQHQQALILGTGGAAKAIAQALQSMGLEYKYVSRNPSKEQLSYSDLDEKIMANYLLIINCTPVGTYPKVNELPNIPYGLLTEKHFLYDLTYNPAITQFLAQGQRQGCKIFNGQKMLEYQADRSWEIWQE